MVQKSCNRPLHGQMTLDSFVSDSKTGPLVSVIVQTSSVSSNDRKPSLGMKMVISKKNGVISVVRNDMVQKAEDVALPPPRNAALIKDDPLREKPQMSTESDGEISDSASKRAGLSRSQQRRLNRPCKSRPVEVIDLTAGEDEPQSSGYSSASSETTRKPGALTAAPSVRAKPSAAVQKSLGIGGKNAKARSVQTLLTDVGTIRRESVRTKEKNAVESKKRKEQQTMIDMILRGREDPRIKVVEFPEKGRGLVAKLPFLKDEFVVEYAGDLISIAEARKREATYAENSQIGCYMYYFTHRDKRLCLDATAETGRYGRLLNHSVTSFNLKTKVVEIPHQGNVKPYLILKAERDIGAGEELVYDYGDRDRDTLTTFPWLKT